MPNLNQIYSLKQKYRPLTTQENQAKDYIEKSEARDVLKKSFDLGMLNENRETTKLFSFLNESINAKPGIINYFDEAIEEDVCLLFIDITSFSKTIAGWTSERTKRYLDNYYDRIIPIIYENGGEIEKLMGDGIICVFGRPFLNLDSPNYVYKAEKCAEGAIKEFHGTNKNVKVAIHKGEIKYYKVPGEHYGEYTMIGQPITDLYRLESVSKPNAINFYSESTYDWLGWKWSIFDDTIVRCKGLELEHELQGVDYTKIKYMQFPGYD